MQLSACTDLQVWSAPLTASVSPSTPSLQLRRSSSAQKVSPLRLSLSKVSAELPVKLFDEDEEDEAEESDGFRTARSPSELLIKYHEEDLEDHIFIAEDSPTTDIPPRAQMPLELITDLRHMLDDYYRRFPPSESASSVPHTPIPKTPPATYVTHTSRSHAITTSSRSGYRV